MRTGEQHSIEVQPSYGINDAEIERMLEESIEYAEQDFAERQVIEARTESEAILARHRESLDKPTSRGASRGRARQNRCSGCGLKEADHRQRLQTDSQED